jgi:hypothetical protein
MNIIEKLNGLPLPLQQLMKDVIENTQWGDCDEYFLNDKGEKEEVSAYAYCTNDTRKFKGIQKRTLFRQLYAAFGLKGDFGHYMSHCSDWWGDGSGDMLFLRSTDIDAVEQWAKTISY